METIRCGRDGQWQQLPLCTASQCTPLSDVPHANTTILNGDGRNYGTIVRFECDDGYVRTGDPVLLCQSNGTWSGAVPSCSKVRIILHEINERTVCFLFGRCSRPYTLYSYMLVSE